MAALGCAGVKDKTAGGSPGGGGSGGTSAANPFGGASGTTTIPITTPDVPA